MNWDQLTSKQLSALDKKIPVLLNLTATEQHGPHLPLSTDRLIGEHFATGLNMEIPEKILILPSVSVGCSDHHMGFSGSLSLSHSTFSAVVKDVITSVFHHGFHHIILLNSHGGNQGIMQVIVEQLGFENPTMHVVGVTWWNLVKEELKTISETGQGGTGHACEFETSLIQTIAPHLVDNAQVQKGANVPTFSWAEGDMLQGPKAAYYRTMKSMTPNGIFGNPIQSSAQKGERITACVVKALVNLVSDLNRG